MSSAYSYSTVSVKIDPTTHVATVSLNRPKKRNALNRKLFEEVGLCFRQIDRDSDVRAVVLTGGESKLFCSGIDLQYLGSFSAAEMEVLD